MSSDFYRKLIDIGIRIIITTRVCVGNDIFEVKPVEDTLALFKRYYGSQDKNDCNDEELVKQIIDVLHGNTMLIILAAQLWKRCNASKRKDFFKELTTGRLQDNDMRLTIAGDIEVDDRTMTIYEQAEAMLDLSGVLSERNTKKVFANMILLPLRGIEKDAFLELTNSENDNYLNLLIEECWVLKEGNVILLHPVVREIALKRGIVDYQLCVDYCENINEKQSVSIFMETQI